MCLKALIRKTATLTYFTNANHNHFRFSMLKFSDTIDMHPFTMFSFSALILHYLNSTYTRSFSFISRLRLHKNHRWSFNSKLTPWYKIPSTQKVCNSCKFWLLKNGQWFKQMTADKRNVFGQKSEGMTHEVFKYTEILVTFYAIMLSHYDDWT